MSPRTAHVKLLQNGLAGIVGILPPYLCLHSGPKIVLVSQGEERDAVWVSSPRSSASWRKKSCTFFRKGESPKDATHVSNFWIQARSSIFSVHLWIYLFTSSQSWDRSISPILDGPDEAVED